MKEKESSERYPVLRKNDEELLDELLALLSQRADGNAYDDAGAEFAAKIQQLPVGLRSMAATNCLDMSLTMDDIGWHFGNFGNPQLVKETERGLRELELTDLAEWFHEANEIVQPLLPQIDTGKDFADILRDHKDADRLDELSAKAWALDKATGSGKSPEGSAIYTAWVKYARTHPELVFD